MKSGLGTPRPSRLSLLTATALTGALTATLLAMPAPASAATVTISAVQGSTRKSTYNAQDVTVTGIVTAIRSTGSSRGYWIQDPVGDGNPATSEAVFAFTGSTTPSTKVGNKVTVKGRVSEYYPGGTSAGGQSLTELTQPQIQSTVSTGNPLPAPVVLDASSIPAAYAPSGNLENLTLAPSSYALDLYESLEGMRVQVDNARVVGPSNEYNELFVSAKPNENPSPRGGTVYGSYTSQNTGRIKVMSLTGALPTADVGDVLDGSTAGPLDFDGLGGYTIHATTLGTLKDNNLSAEKTRAQSAGELAVATYNVENLDPTDPQSKFDRLAGGIVSNLSSPDIVTLEEVQDNNGATNNGVVAADQTYTKLINAITAAGGPTYAYRQINPSNGQDGGEPGGNIRVGFLYNPARVGFTDRPGGTATNAVSVVNNGGTAALSYSPGRINPTNSAWSGSRKPLVGEFTFQGKTVFLIANHFTSKGGDQSLDARVQPPTRSSETQRSQQAAQVNTFVKQLLAVQPSARVVVLGDLNDFEFSGTLSTLTAGTGLTDLPATLPAGERYTYVYQGNSQVLDHILTSSALSSYDYDIVHTNAEFADRASDHDPQIVRLSP
ncbi:endonuclease/exonuclease/phosphatase family protein [Streptomyces sp. KM273126]|uniref:endonuclease/exonuclease/phosphatase family protein n=1 Tax=Streptomyces sp. KM273126 TaxID=2545247 RepID=UPI001405302E|nr:endonuclease/exonuclease/phosphatase family protein [Streptomyces sp. KM273126]MBA2809998.1 endonuclease/exonuclease/phosphatase family protein [Streptomyces sp. KM273126]